MLFAKDYHRFRLEKADETFSSKRFRLQTFFFQLLHVSDNSCNPNLFLLAAEIYLPFQEALSNL